MIEISTGIFPYKTWTTPFEQLKQVVSEDAPRLPATSFSHTYQDFITKTYVIIKDLIKRINNIQVIRGIYQSHILLFFVIVGYKSGFKIVQRYNNYQVTLFWSTIVKLKQMLLVLLLMSSIIVQQKMNQKEEETEEAQQIITMGDSFILYLINQSLFSSYLIPFI